MLIELFNINSTSFITFSTGKIDSYCKGNGKKVCMVRINQKGRKDRLHVSHKLYLCLY